MGKQIKMPSTEESDISIQDAIAKKYPCRNEVIETLCQLIGDPEEAYPSAIFLHGHSGKTAIARELLHQVSQKYGSQSRSGYLNCVECYTTRILLENLLEALTDTESSDQPRCENLKMFLDELRKSEWQNADSAATGYLAVLDNAERLRDMDANLLPSLLRMQELTGLNICVVLISQLPFEKFHCKTGLADVQSIYLPQYTKADTLRILSNDLANSKRLLLMRLKRSQDKDMARKLKLIEDITADFYNNYLNVFLSVFYKACRDLPELTITARKCFSTYMEPVLDGSVEATDVSRLWRHIAGPLRSTLAQVYMRMDNSQEQTLNAIEDNSNSHVDQSVRKLAQSLELPYYGKFLLIAAFLASHNSAKEDKRLFVKNHGKQRKRMQSVNAKAKTVEKMSTSLGPKSFSIDRLLAIFYAILEEKVGLTCNLLSQISTLVHLKLLSFVSGESNVMDGSSRLQCTVGLEFVMQIGKVVGFNVRQYLCDFM